MKKFLSLALATVMGLSLCATAFAADVTDLSEGAELEVSGTTQGATISLTVPTSAAVVVNPYKMDVSVPGAAADAAKVNGQIVSAPYYLENNSSLDIEVGVKMTANVEGDVTLVGTAAAATADSKKNVFAFLDLQAVKDNTVVPTWTTAAAHAAGDTQIPLAAEAKTGKMVLKATDNSAATPSALDVMAFTFVGAANEKAETPWTSEDTVGATIVFSFKVSVPAATPAP